MMRKVILIGMMVLITSLVFAEGTVKFNFQGRLNDSLGTPVPNGRYDVVFRIYSDSVGGTLLWSEFNPGLMINSGILNVNPGSLIPCSLSVFDNDSVYLEVQIGDDAIPLHPRMKITQAPRSGSSERVIGDIRTLPGSIRMFAPQPEPPHDPLLEMNAGVAGDASIYMFAPQPEPPLPDPTKILSISSSPTTGGSIKMFAPQPEPPHDPTLEMNSGLNNEASIYMFAPQPEPPLPDPLHIMEISSSPSNGANIRMFAPQPEPPYDPLLRIGTEGGDVSTISTSAHQDGSMHETFRVKTSPTASSVLIKKTYEDAGIIESTGVSMQADSLTSEMRVFSNGTTKIQAQATSSSGLLNLFNQGAIYMGVAPSPFIGGGELKLYSGAPPYPANITLSSAGILSIGTTSQSNIITVKQSSATDPIADAWTVYSSRRWKTNIAPIGHGLDKVMALQGVTYDWKDSGKHDIGLIAEDVGMVIPEVVAYEENGKDAKSVDYARLVAVLIEAVKEQQGIIRGLETDINQLQNQYESLSNELVNIRKMKSETTAEPKH